MEITPEYIFEQIDVLSKEDLIILIEEFGEQEREKGVDAQFYGGQK